MLEVIEMKSLYIYIVSHEVPLYALTLYEKNFDKTVIVSQILSVYVHAGLSA
jgi:hypothetical protein